MSKTGVNRAEVPHHLMGVPPPGAVRYPTKPLSCLTSLVMQFEFDQDTHTNTLCSAADISPPPPGRGVLHQIFGNRAQYAIKKLTQWDLRFCKKLVVKQIQDQC